MVIGLILPNGCRAKICISIRLLTDMKKVVMIRNSKVNFNKFPRYWLVEKGFIHLKIPPSHCPSSQICSSPFTYSQICPST